jgi:hypothetical protein
MYFNLLLTTFTQITVKIELFVRYIMVQDFNTFTLIRRTLKPRWRPTLTNSSC